MRYWTYGEVREKVARDLDLGDITAPGSFITPAEMMGYYNEAVDAVEADILSLYEDYFLKSAAFPIVSGQSDYSLPEDIYASKIRGLVYSNGSTTYTVPRIRDWKKFQEFALASTISSNHAYQYILSNPSADDGVVLTLVPSAKETSINMRLWYIRNANRATQDSDKCDIPEFVSYVIGFMKFKIMGKEMNPGLELMARELVSIRQEMQSTLRDMVPDGDTALDLDMSTYEEMS